MTLKKRITLQRVETLDDVKRALAEIERAINSLVVDKDGKIVVATNNSGGQLGETT